MSFHPTTLLVDFPKQSEAFRLARLAFVSVATFIGSVLVVLYVPAAS